MTETISLLPLGLALIVGVLVLAIPYSQRLDWIASIFSRGLFARQLSASNSATEQERNLLLQAAHYPTTYRAYAARTYLYSAIYGIIGSIFGVYVIAGFLHILTIPQETLAEILPGALAFLSNFAALGDLSVFELLPLLLLSTGTLGLLLAYATHELRWWLVKNRASIRGRHIEKTLPAIVAFFYAMSRNGIPFSNILSTLAENKSAYGSAAEEVEIASRDIEVYGEDLNTALRRMAHRSPSTHFEEFTQNLISVLDSGRNVSTFLREQYERYQEDLENQQQQFLSTLATLAEIYVSIFVVGSLLLVTVLAVIGVFGVGDTHSIIRALVYLIIPLANLVFIIYLDSITQTSERSFVKRTRSLPLAGLQQIRSASDPSTGNETPTEDANTAIIRERLNAYYGIQAVKDSLTKPKQTLVRTPETIFYVIAPIAALIAMIGFWPYRERALSGMLDTPIQGLFEWSPEVVQIVTAIDDYLILALLVLTSVFSIAYRYHVKRVREIEHAVPDFLDRLASVNDAGMTIVESIERVDTSSRDLGALSTEIERTIRDIEWGADAATALYNLEQRTQTAAMTRVVTLITNALRSSGNISPILRIAADEAQNIRQLRERRRQEMFTYLIVIYLSFFVFMLIIAALSHILIPSMPNQTADLGAFFSGSTGSDSDAAYTLTLFHTAVIQGLFAGLVAGQMGEGSLKAGAKHATILVALAYILFVVIL